MRGKSKLNKIVIGAILLTAASSFLIFASCASDPITADMILINGNVVTVDSLIPRAEAIAIAGDRILAVGTTDEINRLKGSRTYVLDLGGKTVYPGFIEGHAHFMGLGKKKMRLDLMVTNNWEEIVAMVAAEVKKRKPGEWILGRGWHQSKWDKPPQPSFEGLPYHDDLTLVSPDNPVWLTHASGHSAIANQMAMDLAELDDKTKNPDGGEIIKDKTGRVIGVFLETAQSLVGRAYAQVQSSLTADEIDSQNKQTILMAAKECLSKGITSFHDAGVTFDIIDLYRKLAEEGKLGVRLWVMIGEENDNLKARLKDYKIIGAGNNHLTVRSIKRMIDGALGSHGAWLLKPYDDLPTSSGINTEEITYIAETAKIARENGFQLCTHAIGDRGNREILDIYETTLGELAGSSDQRWRIEHAQHLSAQDIERFGELGVIAAMQGIHCTSDGPWVPNRIGMDRAEKGAYVWQKLIQSGATLVNGTDAPVEDVDPLACYFATVTRRMSNGDQFFPKQCMTREEALQSYTINAAYAAFEEEIKGSITVGKLADLVVLSADILEIPADQIPDTDVLYTIVGGEILYKK